MRMSGCGTGFGLMRFSSQRRLPVNIGDTFEWSDVHDRVVEILRREYFNGLDVAIKMLD
jgi:hypothetical protein